MSGERIAVLGCGPAGMIAAHTAARLGAAPSIFSYKAVRSVISGAQYLHKPIPAINFRGRTVEFVKEGSQRGYAAKVYDDPEAPCSWSEFPEGRYPMWSLRSTYNWLWSAYSGLINETFIDAGTAAEIATNFDLTISTIPADNLCDKDHNFPKVNIWIRPEAPDYVKEGQVMYSGDPRTAWYRASRLDGIGSTEYGHSVVGAMKGIKPLNTNCDCLPQITRAGRFGTWRKGVLLHQVEPTVETALSLLRREP